MKLYEPYAFLHSGKVTPSKVLPIIQNKTWAYSENRARLQSVLIFTTQF